MLDPSGRAYEVFSATLVIALLFVYRTPLEGNESRVTLRESASASVPFKGTLTPISSRVVTEITEA